MKSIIILFVALCLSLTTWAQDKPKYDKFESAETVNTRDLPEIIIKRVGEDFSVYLPEFENKDQRIQKLQDAFIAYDLGNDYDGYENYLVTMKLKDASLVATYNENGKLTSVVEKYDNVSLPMPVIYGVYKNYPGWKIVKDRYNYTQSDGDVQKKEYSIKLEKDRKTKTIVVSSKGEILKG